MDLLTPSVGLLWVAAQIGMLAGFIYIVINIGRSVKLLRAIHKELQDLNNPTVQKARRFDASTEK